MKREAEEGKIMRMKERETNVRIDGKENFGGKRKYEREGGREDEKENKR